MVARSEQARRLKVEPNPARRGDIVTIKTMAEHEMEPGVRMDPVSLVVYPRFILNRLICRYNGTKVFESEWFSGVSANPYMAFKIRAERSGPIEIEWVDDYNASTFASVDLVVEDEIGEDGSTPRGDSGGG